MTDPFLAEETLRFFERFLPPAPARVLVVGGDDPGVAALLASRGHAVEAADEGIEPSSGPGSDLVRWIPADLLHIDATDAYDVVAFAWALHRASPPSQALDRARSLLKPGGLLLAEEVAFDRVNVHTARWLYDLETVLVASEVLAPPEPRFAEESRPLLRWRQEHAAEPPLQSGHDMLAAARDRFALEAVEEAPYLYRHLAGRLEQSDRGARVLRRLHELESRLVRERDIAAAGLRMAGRPLG